MIEDSIEYVIEDKSRHGVTDVQAAVNDAWIDIQVEGTEANARAKRAGIEVSSLPAEVAKLLGIRPSAAGIGTVDFVLVALGPVAWDVWKHVLLPQIRERWGDNAIKEKKKSDKVTEKKAPTKNDKN